jgi:DNA-binding SARP family transcriptional activator
MGQGDIEFRLLGPLELRPDGRLKSVRAAKQRALLAALLLQANQVVSADQLIEELWGGNPPSTARNTLQTLVLRLRRVLRPPRSDRPPPERLVTDPSGYLLIVGPDQLDLHRFERVVDQARRALATGRAEQAAADLRDALALWRGPALAGVPSSPLVDAEAIRLEADRLAALEARVEADLACGRHRELVGELEGLVVQFPLRETLQGQLMRALYGSGRQADALHVYREARTVLIEQLGVEPAAELQRLERAVLSGDPSLEPAPLGGAEQHRPAAPVPCQLPADITDFTGREEVVAALLESLGQGDGEDERAPVVVSITGAAGMGKTALAVHVAHRLRSHFPEGQLYVNLQGAEARALDPGEVLARFLAAFGIDGPGVPAGTEERASLYRSRLADRRVLVVLDNAAGEAQVRPLLPGSAGCAVIVTGRAPLAGIPAAQALALDLLTPAQSVDLLAAIVGRGRVSAEPAAARTIVECCGRLPLALRIAGAKLAARPQWRLARLTDRLGDECRRLDELRAGDLEVRASVALSYQGRSDDERRLVRLLGLSDGPDFAVWAAAALQGVPLAVAEDQLERLVDAQLLQAADDAAGQARYRFHDLLRVFAAERAQREEPAAARQTAVRRLLIAALTLAARAAAGLEFGGLCVPAGALAAYRRAAPGALPAVIDERPADWLAVEQATLSAAVTQAYKAELWEPCWLLAGSLAGFFEIHASWDAWQRTHTVALQAARRGGDRRGEAAMLRSLGALARDQARWDQAIAFLEASLRLYDELGDQHGQAAALLSLGNVHRGQGHSDDAQACLARSRQLFHALGDRRWEAASLQSLGDVHIDQGHDQLACAHLEQALERFCDLGDRLWQACTLRELGQAHLRFGRPDAALACLRDCLPILRDAGDRRGQAIATRTLGHVQRELGRFDQATASYEQARSLFRELGIGIGCSSARPGASGTPAGCQEWPSVSDAALAGASGEESPVTLVEEVAQR